MNDTYHHGTVEAKWRERWERERTYEVDLDRATRPYYNLMMFPYPSAEGLHVGNMFPFVGSDIQGRYRRALGFDVFEPMGFDAFGMHSENHAIRTGVHPRDAVQRNIRRFREEQLKRIGNMFDWSHEVDTTDPSYYRWTQWIFLQLHRAGLAYRGTARVTWCPSCKTVLADEQAEGGICERCEAPVERRPLEQWFLKITSYAQRLLDNLEWIDWSDVTRNTQRRWIGRSDGADIRFEVPGADQPIAVFSTRPDTLWGATYLVLAPEHPMLPRIVTDRQRDAVARYTAQIRAELPTGSRTPDAPKTGAFTGACALHPATGARIPIWVADYVSMDCGEGAVMGVPAHDARDHAFARQFGLPAVRVVRPVQGGLPNPSQAYEGEGVLEQSGPFTGTHSAAAREGIMRWLTQRDAGGPSVRYRLRDWCISRQRYWGPPIPMVHCAGCGAVPVPEADLPVRLPHVAAFAPDGSGLSPLARQPGFVRTRCPNCGNEARRETDVSDNFLDSAWYFLRYPSTHRGDVAFDSERTRKWLPVDMYVGGNEHAVLHLMYTRFVSMALHDIGLIPFEEPFTRFRANGLIVKEGAKMSKSRGNVVNPDTYLERYGADVFRTYLMFFGDFALGGDFRDDNIAGVERFLHRLWRYASTTEFERAPLEDPGVLKLLAHTTQRVTRDIERLHYNTALASIMELLAQLGRQPRRYRECVRVLLTLLGPFAPFITHELWERIGESGMLCDQPWPRLEAVNPEEDVQIVIQVNGKVRDRVRLPIGATEGQAVEAALAREAVRRHADRSRVRRSVFVPGRLLNIVTR